jgi:hypothetical protein
MLLLLLLLLLLFEYPASRQVVDIVLLLYLAECWNVFWRADAGTGSGGRLVLRLHRATM